MIHGIDSGKIPTQLIYAEIIQKAADDANVSALLCYAIANRETLRGQRAGSWDAASVVSADGGHGLFQLTSSWPSDWADPSANTAYAIAHFIKPAMDWLVEQGLEGDALIKGIAASFNAGLGAAWNAHVSQNDFDACTTGNDYASDVLANYLALHSGHAVS